MRAKTIRKLSPLARELARLQNEHQSMKRRLDKLIRMAQEAELKATALDNMNGQRDKSPEAHGIDPDYEAAMAAWEPEA